MSGEDRTEAPTPKKRRDARRKGQVPRAPMFIAWLQILAAAYLLPGALSGAGWAVAGSFERIRTVDGSTSGGEALAILGAGLRGSMVAIAPLVGAILLIGVLGGLAQTQGLVVPKLWVPKADRINPAKGLKRLVSPPALLELAKVTVLTLVLAVLCWGPIRDLTMVLVSADRPTTLAAVQHIGEMSLLLMGRVAMAGLAVAGVELAIALRRHRKQLRMTKQEVKDEMRQSEGDPHMRGRIRSKQMAMSRNRMIAAVASSKVVVVNPTHVAVALSYEKGQHAPTVVAKGGDHLAARIRAEAEKHGVPIVRDVALARALFGACDLGDPVPVELYEAVAKVLAFVFTLGARKAFGGVLDMTPALAR